MSSNRARRVTKEIADIHNDTLSNISATSAGNGDDLMHLKGTFKGPPGTPYEGGTYMIDIKIPNEYPFRPPTMKFDTKVWHPNVSSQTGAICLDTLSGAWSPVLTIKSALLSLQSLLSTPEPKDPQDAEVAGMLMRNPREFERVAQEWAVKYAGAPKRERGENSGGATSETLKQRQKKSKEQEEAERIAQYGGYNEDMINRFVMMGFDLDRVVSAFEFVGIDSNGGEDYELEEAYIGDITARLLGEP
ncbi:MAG: Ubiquitin-conjugating enzyme E2 1 [Icmadophila ericetorum]|nr:Ubiquitin-conjugating enzyme E2 1 [Icmadophila ericetorum]